MEANGGGTPIPIRSAPGFTREISYSGCSLHVDKLPEGARRLRLVDPGSGTVHLLEMDADNAREIARDLSSGVEIAGAHQLPPAEAL